jgi:hypothetical protein
VIASAQIRKVGDRRRRHARRWRRGGGERSGGEREGNEASDRSERLRCNPHHQRVVESLGRIVICQPMGNPRVYTRGRRRGRRRGGQGGGGRGPARGSWNGHPGQSQPISSISVHLRAHLEYPGE